MRFVPAFVAVLALTAACDKKKEGDPASGGTAGAADPVAKGGDTAKSGNNSGETKPGDPPAPPKPPKAPAKTGVLDVELQEVDGGWKVLTPRASRCASKS